MNSISASTIGLAAFTGAVGSVYTATLSTAEAETCTFKVALASSYLTITL